MVQHRARAGTLCSAWECRRLAVDHDGRCDEHRRRGGRRWRRLVAAVHARAGGRCEGCGGPGPLAVHHTRPLVRGGVELAPEDELLALCSDCHDAERLG